MVSSASKNGEKTVNTQQNFLILRNSKVRLHLRDKNNKANKSVMWPMLTDQVPTRFLHFGKLNENISTHTQTRTCFAFFLCFSIFCGLVNGCIFCQMFCLNVYSVNDSFYVSLYHEPSLFPFLLLHVVSSFPALLFPVPALFLVLLVLVSLFLTCHHGQVLLFFFLTFPKEKFKEMKINQDR